MVHGCVRRGSCGVSWRVQLRYELTVGGSGGVEVLVAFLELETETDGVLLECDDLVLELIDVVGSAESGLVPCLFAERVGQTVLELLDAGGEARC